jgi:hypothetical protein
MKLWIRDTGPRAASRPHRGARGGLIARRWLPMPMPGEMLGEKLGETRGRITGTRVLDGGALEHTALEQGSLLGVEVVHLVTFTTHATPAGVVQARGRGRYQTPDGEVATWGALGIVTPSGQGMAGRLRAAGITSAPAGGKLAALNQAPILFEGDLDAQGNLRVAIRRWA